jgi:hypothetical protein
MTTQDLNIITKKILIGFVIYLVPLLIIVGGLSLIKFLSAK